MKIKMVVEEIVLALADDSTKLVVRDKDFKVLASGNWYQDNVLDYMQHIVNSFILQDDNVLYIDIKEGQTHDAE